MGIILFLVLVSAEPSSHCCKSYPALRLSPSGRILYIYIFSVDRSQAVYMNHDTNAGGEQRIHERQKRK